MFSSTLLAVAGFYLESVRGEFSWGGSFFDKISPFSWAKSKSTTPLFSPSKSTILLMAPWRIKYAEGLREKICATAALSSSNLQKLQPGCTNDSGAEMKRLLTNTLSTSETSRIEMINLLKDIGKAPSQLLKDTFGYSEQSIADKNYAETSLKYIVANLNPIKLPFTSQWDYDMKLTEPIKKLGELVTGDWISKPIDDSTFGSSSSSYSWNSQSILS